MKSIVTSFFLALLATSCLAGEKEKAFEESFRSAVSMNDQAMFELVQFANNTPKLFRDMIMESLREDRKKTIKAISFSDPAKDAVFEFEYGGTTYTTSLPVVKEMKIKYDMTKDASGVEGTTYRLGLHDGVYKIVVPQAK
ncbi:MAG: hypothetical protein AAGA18_10620 [Verrucomicrobiota bacterium]